MTQRFDIAGMGDPYNDGFFLSMDHNRLIIFLGDHGYYQAPNELNDNTWHFALATRRQAAVGLYIDGVKVVEGAHERSIMPGTSTFVIGKHGTKNESYFKGDIDDVFLYERSFTDEQVLALYRSMSGMKFTFLSPQQVTAGASLPLRWASLANTVSYALEIDTSSVFASPLISVAVEDTSYTLTQGLTPGAYYVRIGANFDDLSAFYFSEPHSIIAQ
jgi:hypothetical protein